MSVIYTFIGWYRWTHRRQPMNPRGETSSTPGVSRLKRLVLRQNSGCLNILRQACRTAFSHLIG
jgi:hypothetical protein